VTAAAWEDRVTPTWSMRRFRAADRVAMPTELTVTVIVPDLAVRHWWQRPLHEDTAAPAAPRARAAPKVVVTSLAFTCSAASRR